MPKLLNVVSSLNPGGAERLAVQMSLAFAREFDVSVVCLDDPGLWAQELRRQSIPVHCLYRQPGLDVSIAWKLANFCRSLRVDIIHAHQCTPWFYAALSRLIYGRPRLLLEEHGRFYPEVPNPERAFVNRFFIAPLTHRFIAVSEDVKNRLVEFEGLDRNKIEVVYNGVAPDPPLAPEERDDLRRSLGIKPGDFLVGTAGRLDPIKNFPMFLKSIASAREAKGSIRGLLVGNGPHYSQTRKFRDDLGLATIVAMPGHRDDARRLIGCMDLFVLSSLSEGTSMALIEAMAAQVPVAVTAVGGNPEVVLGGRTGWVVPSDSASDLKNAILEAASGSGRTRQFAQAGRSRFEEKFTLDKMLANYRRIYAEML